MREVEYRSSGVPLEEYELTRGDHRRQKQSEEISEWARRQVEEDDAKCRADPERTERRRQAFENVAKLMQSFKKADHEIMRWRVQLELDPPGEEQLTAMVEAHLGTDGVVGGADLI
ncbi:hypothetical protein ACN6LA_005886, partial [Streptomyces sp. SAS_269]